MGFIANNVNIKGQEVVEQPKAAATPASRPVKKMMQQPRIEPLQTQVQIPQSTSENKDNVLIVNGKEKKVRKQSAYMLDMLTIDDE